MKLAPGTRSLLYGVHAFWLHPFFVAIAWWRLYGFPVDPRLWMAFLLHDIGYWGKADLNGPEGLSHPILGATLMHQLFGSPWGDFCLLHSRFYADHLKHPVSQLCYADKAALLIEPAWFYLFRARLSGELDEYLTQSASSSSSLVPFTAEEQADFTSGDARRWLDALQKQIARWLQSVNTQPLWPHSALPLITTQNKGNYAP